MAGETFVKCKEVGGFICDVRWWWKSGRWCRPAECCWQLAAEVFCDIAVLAVLAIRFILIYNRDVRSACG